MSLLLSPLLVILLQKLLDHFTLLHNIKIIYKALHNTTFLSDYSVFYCFLFLSRISLIFSIYHASFNHLLIFFKNICPPFYASHPYSYQWLSLSFLKSHFYKILIGNHLNSRKDISSLLTYFTHVLIHLILYSKIRLHFSLRRGSKMNHYFY